MKIGDWRWSGSGLDDYVRPHRVLTSLLTSSSFDPWTENQLIPHLKPEIENCLTIFHVLSPQIRDTGRHRTSGRRGVVLQIMFTLYGTHSPPSDLKGRKPQRAYKMSAADVRRTFVREREAALEGMPQHRDVLELKRALIESKKIPDLKSRLSRMREDPFVTQEEILEVLRLAERKS